jgi:hypothetical protein
VLIAGDWRTNEEHYALRVFAAQGGCVVAGSTRAIRSAMSNLATRVLMIGTDKWDAVGPDAVLRWIEEAPQHRHVVVRHQASSADIARALRVVRNDANIRMSSREHQPLSWLLANGIPWVTSPAPRLAARIERLIAPPDVNVVTTLLFECMSATSLADAARAVGTNARGLRRRLQTLRNRYGKLPAFPTLNATLVLANALWVADIHGWKGDLLTQLVGFDDLASFNLYAWRHAGASCETLRKRRGYAAFEHTIIGWFEMH